MAARREAGQDAGYFFTALTLPGGRFVMPGVMNPSCLAHVQLKAYSACLDEIYSLTPGENPIVGILDAIGRLLRVDTLAADEMKGGSTGRQNGPRLVRHTHLASRGFEGFPLVCRMPLLASHDHPMILHVLKHGRQSALRMSDFVTQRQLRNISLYEFNSRVHEWRDQTAIVAAVAGGSISIALNRDRVFRDEEFLLLSLLQPHLERVINRCALFKRLPGNEQITAREREVLYWIMQGKRDEEIAVIIRAAPRTINKHTGAILAKLGVENRASAAAMVLAEARQPHRTG